MIGGYEDRGYNGNPQLKKTGTRQEYTPEQLAEYIKCSEDPLHFVETYCKIITLDSGLQLFKPFEFQKKMLKAFYEKRFIINLLPRQSGKSTIVAAFLLHYAIFNPDKFIGILANKAAVAREILSRLQRMYENLPFWLQPGIKTYNKGSMVLGNDSTIIAASTSSSSVRGFSFNCVVGSTPITIRNKNTGEIREIQIGEFANVINNTTANSPMNRNNKLGNDFRKPDFEIRIL